MQSGAGGPAIFAGAAAASPPAPAVPSGFGGTEPAMADADPGALSWCGYTWEAENWGTAPGQPRASQVSVNSDGHLVLSAAEVNGQYRGAEVASARGDRGLTGNGSTWGHGTYRWVIGTDLTTLAPGLVLGLFTYWAASKGGPPGQKEIDIEISDFGIPGAPRFLQMGFYQDTPAGTPQAVPAGHTMVTGSQAARSSPATTVQFTWLPASIVWEAWFGADTTGIPDVTLPVTQGQAYSYTQAWGGNQYSGTVEIPATGGQQVIMNLWAANATPPAGNAAQTAVLQSFSYTPYG